MWTAKIKDKQVVNEQLLMTVDFTDGAKVLTETCKPQDETGFRHWVDSRLKSLNGSDVLKSSYTIGDTIDTGDETPIETEQDIWMKKFYRLERVQRLIDLGIVPNDNAKVVSLRNDLKTTIKPEYIDTL